MLFYGSAEDGKHGEQLTRTDSPRSRHRVRAGHHHRMRIVSSAAPHTYQTTQSHPAPAVASTTPTSVAPQSTSGICLGVRVGCSDKNPCKTGEKCGGDGLCCPQGSTWDPHAFGCTDGGGCRVSDCPGPLIGTSKGCQHDGNEMGTCIPAPIRADCDGAK